MVDIYRIYFFNRRDTSGPTDRVLLDLLRELISFLRVEDLLRVVEAAQFVVLRQDDRAGDDGSRKRRHAGFINTGDHAVTLRPEFDFEAQQEVQALAFGTILAIAFANAFSELLRTLTRIRVQRFK